MTIDLAAAASGLITLDAPAKTPSAGIMKLDAKVQLTAMAKSTIPGATYDGPIQGAPDLSIALAGQTAFDATAIGKASTLMVQVMPSDLVTLPLATLLGVPAVTGNLDLKVTGGTVTAVYTAVCATDGKYSGTLVTSGSVMLGGSLDVSVPLVGDMTFPLPNLSVTLPSLTSAINFTSKADPMGLGCSGVKPTDGGSNNPDGAMNPPPDGMIGTTGTATVSVAGTQMTVSNVMVWPTDANGYSTNNSGHYSVFIAFSGTGFPSGSQIQVDLFQSSTTCVDAPSFPSQDLWLENGGGTQYLTTDGAGCGLSVTLGSGTASGSFTGTVTNIESSSDTTTAAVSFNVTLP